MNESNLERLMRLAQRTGGTLIVTNEEGEEPIVLMGVAEYEALHGIAQSFEGGGESSYYDDDLYEEDVVEPTLETITEAYESFTPPSLPVKEEKGRTGPKPKDEDVPEESEEQGVPVSPEKVNEADEWDEIGGEERFYLEPIE